MSEPKLRLDKWLWQARFFKSRSIASTMCKARKVRVNGQHAAKASQTVGVGDILTFPQANRIRVIEIIELGTRRGPATEAVLLYNDLTPPEEKAEDMKAGTAKNPTREKGQGRPTKADRRALDHLQKRD